MGKEVHATEEQLRYATILDIGMKVGMLMLIVSFALYLTGILQPQVPVDELPKLWGLSVHKYLEVKGLHGGWSWLHLLNKGDFLNFTGIVFLGAVTIMCFLAIIPMLFRKKDIAYGIIAMTEVIVLILAASGLLKTGGH
ncbi:MAG: hypothetical protein HQK92_04920 [Nitrospirae bacterium]|nr:hypothetical protein [Nitrospirota bacterium]